MTSKLDLDLSVSLHDDLLWRFSFSFLLLLSFCYFCVQSADSIAKRKESPTQLGKESEKSATFPKFMV